MRDNFKQTQDCCFELGLKSIISANFVDFNDRCAVMKGALEFLLTTEIYQFSSLNSYFSDVFYKKSGF